MLYTVHTSYKGFDKECPNTPFWCETVKIEAEDKETAKKIAWENIVKTSNMENLAIRAQDARASRRIKTK